MRTLASCDPRREVAPAASPSGVPSPAQELRLSRPLRVLTADIYNCTEPYAERMKVLRQHLGKLDPDMIGFQEAWPRSRVSPETSSGTMTGKAKGMAPFATGGGRVVQNSGTGDASLGDSKSPGKARVSDGTLRPLISSLTLRVTLG